MFSCQTPEHQLLCLPTIVKPLRQECIFFTHKNMRPWSAPLPVRIFVLWCYVATMLLIREGIRKKIRDYLGIFPK